MLELYWPQTRPFEFGADGGVLRQNTGSQAKIVSGFQLVMPSFLGRLGHPQIGAILEFLRSLEARASTPEETDRHRLVWAVLPADRTTPVRAFERQWRAYGGLTRLFRRSSASFNMGGDGFALALRWFKWQ